MEQFKTDFWYGVVAPAGTSDQLVVKIQKALQMYAQSLEGKDAFDRLSLRPTNSSPQAFSQKISDDARHYRELATELNVKPE
jgi:tripartite-type tricarboxylate transporter receptor subunit TctC